MHLLCVGQICKPSLPFLKDCKLSHFDISVRATSHRTTWKCFKKVNNFELFHFNLPDYVG